MIFSNRKQYRDVLLTHDMSLAEYGVLRHVRNNLRHVMAEYLSDCLGCFH